MIWAILFATIFMMLGGDAGLVKDLSKPVKQYVQDEAKAKEILAINKAMMKEAEDFAKEVRQAKQALAKHNRNRSASAGEFQSVFTAMEQGHADVREKILDGRFQMKELMTADEWKKVFADQPME